MIEVWVYAASRRVRELVEPIRRVAYGSIRQCRAFWVHEQVPDAGWIGPQLAIVRSGVSI